MVPERESETVTERQRELISERDRWWQRKRSIMMSEKER
jgi:hypothetical protein